MTAPNAPIAALALIVGTATLALPAAGSAAELSIAPRVGLTILDVDPEVAGVEADSDGDAAFGLTLGYGVSETWSAELEWVSGGGETTFRGSAGSLAADIDVTSLAAYAAYRSEGPLYFSARIGVRRSEVSTDLAGLPDESDTGASFGAGLGYRIGERLAAEASYTLIGSDVSWLMLSVRYAFEP